jgi:molybdopterin molybdotransferase
MALVPYEQAFGRVSARLRATDVTEVPAADSVGLVTADDIKSLDDVPPFDNTAVDGFAVRSADVSPAPVELTVVATIPAGVAPVVTLEEGTCARIMTGAVIPDGADAVVMVEDTESLDGQPAGTDQRVRIHEAASPGQHIRPAGDDLRVGDLAIPAGTRITPAHVGLLATLGRTSVRVHRRPVVGVMSTGDELVASGVPLAPGLESPDAAGPVRQNRRGCGGPRTGSRRRGCHPWGSLLGLGVMRRDRHQWRRVDG